MERSQASAGDHHGESVPEPYLPDELSLSRYWNAARLPSECRTTDGRALQIVYRGQWSYGYGPDFRGAILCFDGGRAVRGDVEVHVCSSGWVRHGHDSNPAYDKVVLHVVWMHDAEIPSGAPVLELSRYVREEDLEGLAQPGALDESICSVFSSPEQGERALRIVEAAGDRRFEARCVTLEGELSCETPGQVLYVALMECMGYSENKLPFRLLAEALPLETLAHTDAMRVFDRLNAASGLDPATLGERLLQREQWRLGRVRPANHPLRRMLGAAQLIASAERNGGLVRHLVEDGIYLGMDGLLRRLQARPREGDPPCIGADRAVDIACNAVLPLAVALARSTGDTGLETATRNAWLELPRGGTTRVERSMRDHLQAPPRGAKLNKARHQQGLLHLYKRYCAQRLCDLCPLSQMAAGDSE